MRSLFLIEQLRVVTFPSVEYKSTFKLILVLICLPCPVPALPIGMVLTITFARRYPGSSSTAFVSTKVAEALQKFSTIHILHTIV